MRKLILCAIYLTTLSLLLPCAVGGSEDEGRITENYKKSYTVNSLYSELTFDSGEDMDQSGNSAWRYKNPSLGTVEDGRLVLNGGEFGVRGTYILGDKYCAETSQLCFTAAMTGGEMSAGVRLKSALSANDTGIWFHIGERTVRVSAGGTKLSAEIEHGLDLTSQHSYTVSNSFYYIDLLADGVSICRVRYEYGGDITVFDTAGASVQSVANVHTPQVGYFRIDFNDFVGYVDDISYRYNEIEQKEIPAQTDREINYGDWVAVDDLSRLTPTSSEYAQREDKYVGLFYFLCHTGDREGRVEDYTKMYVEQGLDALKSFLSSSAIGGYWAEPYFGYYLNTDAWVYNKHATMLTAAGVDFIFLDFSNGVVYEQGLQVLFDTWLGMRQKGIDTPQIVFMTGDMPHVLVHDLFLLNNTNVFDEKYDELFFKWQGKPLLLGNYDDPDSGDITVSPTVGTYTKSKFYESLTEQELSFFRSDEYKSLLSSFTLRKSWAWCAREYENDTKYAGYWDWLDDWPQSTGRAPDGTQEQISVAIASHAHTNKGRSWVNRNTNYGTGKGDFDFSLRTSRLGMCFEQQFERAMEADPSVIMITGWNEWTAGKQYVNNQNQTTGHTLTPGYYYVDQFNTEFSRDAEPMKLRDGVGFGDNYYYQMVQLIRKFKGVQSAQPASGQGSIDLRYADDMFAGVGPVFRDSVGDCVFRCANSEGRITTYVNSTARNDIDEARVSHDIKYLYFTVTTVLDIAVVDDELWMNLFINSDGDYKTGWEGYDYIINRSRTGKTVSVQRFVDNEWKFEHVGRADYSLGDKSLTIRVPKALVGAADDVSIDFKWADNSVYDGDIMQFSDLGDAAPDGRFNFRFISSAADIGEIPLPVVNNEEKPATFGKTTVAVICAAAGVGIAAVVVFVIYRRKKAK